MDPRFVELDAGPDGSQVVRDCLGDLATGLGCAAAFLLLRAGHDASIVAGHGLTAEAAASYTMVWHRLDPWLAALHSPFGGRAVRGENLVSPRLLRASSFHAGWLQPHGLGPAGIADVAEANGTTALLYVLRPAAARPLTRPEVMLLRAVAGALGLVVQRSDLSLGAAAAAEVMGRAVAPVILLLPDGTVLWSNAAAASLWGPDGPLRRQGRRVADRSGDPASPFAQALAAEATPNARPRVIGLSGRLAPVPAKLQPFHLRSGRTAVLLTAAAPATTVPTAEAVAAALGLTRAQAAVAVLLCQGMETAAISDRIGISQHTLNGHLRDLYARLRASNRVQAVVRLLGASAAFGLFTESAAPDTIRSRRRSDNQNGVLRKIFSLILGRVDKLASGGFPTVRGRDSTLISEMEIGVDPRLADRRGVVLLRALRGLSQPARRQARARPQAGAGRHLLDRAHRRAVA